MIVAVTVVVRKDPRSYYLIEGAEQTMRSHRHRNVGAKQAGLLAFADHALDEIKILYQKVVRELGEKLEAVAQFGLEHDGQVAVAAQSFQVQEGEAPQLFPRVGNLGQGRARALREAMEGGVDGRHQQLVLVFEIKVDGAVGHAGAVGDLRYPRMKKTVLGDDLNGGIQDTLMLVRGSAGHGHWSFHRQSP